MAEEELQVIRLKTDFYQDGFSKIFVAIALVITTIIGLAALALYLFFSKPAPIYFATDQDYRVLPPVPVEQPYLNDSDLFQWVSRAIPAAFTYDFLNYDNERRIVSQYFTPNGWSNLNGQLNNYHADFNSLQNLRTFISAEITAAPTILNQGLAEGKYTWNVKIPMNLTYSNGTRVRSLVIVAKVVRISTLDNLYGVAIDSMSITAMEGSQANKNG